MKINQKNNTHKPREYNEALLLAESGKTEEALTCIQEYLASSPRDAEALNDTGALLYSLGYMEEAINHLLKAKHLYPKGAEILWNLSECYLGVNQPHHAIDLFQDMQELGILNADLLNRTADSCLKNGNLIDTVKMLELSLKVSPDQDILHPMIKVIRSKMAENPC
jgi:tetratricopeptide (TPR) repeat protein